MKKMLILMGVLSSMNVFNGGVNKSYSDMPYDMDRGLIHVENGKSMTDNYRFYMPSHVYMKNLK